MATSSITKNFVISGKEQVEMFVNALEASANDRTPPIEVSCHELTDKQEIIEFMRKREKMKANEENK